MGLGLQIYGCSSIFRESPRDFFKKVSEAGYQYIEPCVWFGPMEGMTQDTKDHFWSVEEWEQFQGMMEHYALRTISFHAFGNLLDNMDDLRGILKKYHIPFIVMNTPQENYKEVYDKYIRDVTQIAAKVVDLKTKLFIHNGAGAIENRINGKPFLQAVLEECHGEVAAQVDVGWVAYAGIDPLAFLQEIEPYCGMIHYKDVKGTYKEPEIKQIHICLGEGIVNARGVYEFAIKHNLPQFVDQDASDDNILKDLRKTVDLINGFGEM
jgi:sugar phosphate isomerase/epimerase